MPLVLTSAPAREPVSVSEAKQYLRIDSAVEDPVVASLILAARLHIEGALDIAMVTQSWKLLLDRWPEDGRVEIPLGPLQSVDSVTVYGADDVAQAVPESSYLVDLSSLRPRLVRHAGAVWPMPGRPVNGIEIAVTAGYGDTPETVPQPIRQALLMLVAHWYEQREPVVLEEPDALPHGVADLLAPYRAVRL
ncbi:head-tail connector protein [Dichotomicrobium thermohalophilum]|uniref:Putative phiE125 gp8 family phage protein n=1 Tax=Dichotomicrobium thermohalophilum TaxID=933063 RepID=A0A397QBA6_9HYPH|nr:head-tail connector protein [Dichotomicrobium thermohalophilum]RIA56767.1 putative phiE125 gp8 family phage protein [Dichotomicrobium thermohalophilum]